MKAFAAFAIAAFVIAPTAIAQTRMMQPHAETAEVLQCLLAHGKGCRHDFVARASATGTFWQYWNASKDFDLGKQLSVAYVGTEAQNAYTTRFLNGMTADVYDVRFERRKFTFYIVPPGPDGNVRYIMTRRGDADDETADLWARRP